MDPQKDNEEIQIGVEADEEAATADESVSVDEFIRQLEAKEKDLHITSETTFIELEAEFDDGEVPDFIKDELDGAVIERTSAAVSKQASADRERIKKLEGEVKSLRSKVGDLQEERAELYKNSQRRLKDFEAFKSRTERERAETFERQLSNLATEMLPVLDNLDRALQFAAGRDEHSKGEFSQFFEGIVLVNQQVNEVLAGMGIMPIATVGEAFDPNFHEAVAMDENEDVPPNTVTAELLKGFRIGSRVVRHSMVKVSKAAEPAKPPGPTDENSEEPAPPEDPTLSSEPEGTASKAETGFDAAGSAEPAEEISDRDGEPDAEDEESVESFEIERNGETEKINVIKD